MARSAPGRRARAGGRLVVRPRADAVAPAAGDDADAAFAALPGPVRRVAEQVLVRQLVTDRVERFDDLLDATADENASAARLRQTRHLVAHAAGLVAVADEDRIDDGVAAAQQPFDRRQ